MCWPFFYVFVSGYWMAPSFSLVERDFQPFCWDHQHTSHDQQLVIATIPLLMTCGTTLTRSPAHLGLNLPPREVVCGALPVTHYKWKGTCMFVSSRCVGCSRSDTHRSLVAVQCGNLFYQLSNDSQVIVALCTSCVEVTKRKKSVLSVSLVHCVDVALPLPWHWSFWLQSRCTASSVESYAASALKTCAY